MSSKLEASGLPEWINWAVTCCPIAVVSHCHFADCVTSFVGRNKTSQALAQTGRFRQSAETQRNVGNACFRSCSNRLIPTYGATRFFADGLIGQQLADQLPWFHMEVTETTFVPQAVAQIHNLKIPETGRVGV